MELKASPPKNNVSAEPCKLGQEGEGSPVVLTSALKDWRALDEWDFQYLANRLGSAEVVVNDRAPARWQDREEGSPHQSYPCTLSEYIAYCCIHGE